MERVLRIIMAPFTEAVEVAEWMWDKAGDWGLHVIIRILLAVLMFFGFVAISWFWMGGFSY